MASKDGLKVDAASVTSKAFEFVGGVLEVAATAETGYEARLIIRDPDPASETDIAQVAYASAYSGAEHCIAVGNFVKANDAKPITAGTKYIYRVTTAGKNIAFERLSDNFVAREAAVEYVDEAGPIKGFVGFKTSGAGKGESLTTFHWLRVRKYANPEPQVDASKISKEQAFVSPVFTNTVLASNGDLILAEGQTSGAYITKDFASPYKIRILVPSWKGTGVSVDISADAGSTYKKNCTNNAYYYAAKGDFISGDTITCRVAFKKAAAASISKLEFVAVQYASGSIVVLVPNGAEEWTGGSKQEIKWTAWDYEKSYPMKIEYSSDEGKTFLLIAAKTVNSGIYIWAVPNDATISGKKILVYISDSYDDTAYDVSDKPFFIVVSPKTWIGAPAVSGKEEVPKPKEEAKQAAENVPEAVAKVQEEEKAQTQTSAQIQEAEKPQGPKEYELLVKVGDNHMSNSKEDAKLAYKEGDIVAVMPAGYEWSETERNSFLIVKVQMSAEEVLTLTQPKVILTGKKDKEGDPVQETVRVRKHKVNFKKLGAAVTKELRKGATPVNRVLDTKVMTADVIKEK